MFKRHQQTNITTGLLVSQRYRLEDQLGEGGAGVIYKAKDEQLGRTVAIKLLTEKSGGLAGDKMKRFRSEARSVARLNHPNIITLYDFAEAEEGWPYLVMEYVPGQDLWEFDNSYSPDLMPFTESLPIIDGIFAALEYSHTHSVVHRDLKPENVMITPNNQVKVMDFGLARIQGQSRLTEVGLVAGTASYLAPELALAEDSDHRVDLYAMGVIMYELLTGRRPFSGDDPLTVISQHIHAPVVPPQHHNGNIPNKLQAIILKLLAKNPDERYTNATEVRQELYPILTQVKGGLVINDEPGGYAPRQLGLESTASHQILLDRIAQGQMVGRDNELAELKRRWDLIRMGELDIEPLVLISGEAGIGKNRLLRELQVYVGLRDGYILQGTAREQDEGTPYALFAKVLREYIAQQSTAVLRRQTSDFIAGEVVKLAPQLSEKIGYIPPNPPLEPEAERVRLMEQVSKFILNIANEQPTLLMLGELHYADPGSLTLLETLTCHASTASLLVVGSYRDVALSYSNPINRLVASLESDQLLHRIPLRRLSPEMVKQMLEALLGDTVSSNFANSIYQATEGNPLFIEEVIKSLATDGQLVLREGHWAQRDTTNQLHVPGSIKSVLGRRLERIKKSTLELIQLAAVIGRSFTLDMLAEASGDNEETIQWAIEEALTYQLIEVSQIEDQPDAPPDQAINIRYQFQHMLIRETLYEELRPLRRRQLHRKIATAMETLSERTTIAPIPAVLARHLIAGAQDEKAVPFLREAGDAASQVYANAEAVDYLSQAQEILEDIAPDLSGSQLESNLCEQFYILTEVRKILNMIGDRDHELSTLEKLLAVANELNVKQIWVEAMSRQATFYWEVGKLNEAEKIAHEALEVAQANNDRQGEQYCLEQIARVLWTRRNADSMTYATQALIIAKDLGDRQREGRLTELIGHLYTDTLHDAERAEIYFKQALTITRETGNRIDETWTLWGMGGLALLVDDYTRALQYYNQARKISETIGATLQVGWDLYHTGDAWYCLGNYDYAMDNYQQARAIFGSSHHLRGRIYSLISLGLVSTIFEQFDEAENYLSQATQQAEERNDLILMLRSYQAFCTYYRLLGGEENLTNAIRLSNRVIKLTAEGGHYEHELLGHYLRGASFFELRDLNEARKSSSLAVERLEQLTYLHSPQISAAKIYYGHSQILNTLGQIETARTYLQKAYDETIRKADLITDSQQRRDFLHNVPINHTIMTQAGNGG